MNTQLINQNRQQNFGMGLHMPSEKAIAKKVGKVAASEAESVRGVLADMAKDVDIFVSPKAASRVNNNSLDIYVQDITQPIIESKIPIIGRVINFFRGQKYQYQISSKPSAQDYVFTTHGNIGKKLVADVTKQKEIFLSSK